MEAYSCFPLIHSKVCVLFWCIRSHQECLSKNVLHNACLCDPTRCGLQQYQQSPPPAPFVAPVVVACMNSSSPLAYIWLSSSHLGLEPLSLSSMSLTSWLLKELYNSQCRLYSMMSWTSCPPTVHLYLWKKEDRLPKGLKKCERVPSVFWRFANKRTLDKSR